MKNDLAKINRIIARDLGEDFDVDDVWIFGGVVLNLIGFG